MYKKQSQQVGIADFGMPLGLKCICQVKNPPSVIKQKSLKQETEEAKRASENKTFTLAPHITGAVYQFTTKRGIFVSGEYRSTQGQEKSSPPIPPLLYASHVAILMEEYGTGLQGLRRKFCVTRLCGGRKFITERLTITARLTYSAPGNAKQGPGEAEMR